MTLSRRFEHGHRHTSFRTGSQLFDKMPDSDTRHKARNVERVPIQTQSERNSWYVGHKYMILRCYGTVSCRTRASWCRKLSARVTRIAFNCAVTIIKKCWPKSYPATHYKTQNTQKGGSAREKNMRIINKLFVPQSKQINTCLNEAVRSFSARWFISKDTLD